MMQSIKQFQNQKQVTFASVVSEPKQDLLMDVWNDQNHEDLNAIEVLDHCFDCIHEDNLSNWLSDASELEKFIETCDKAESDYIAINIKHSDLKKFALVSRKPSKAKGSRLTNLLKDCGVEAHTFKSSMLAMQWLLVPSMEDEAWDDVPVMVF